ncbi:hypothetical protein [Sphingomonas aerolata]|uniref:hypothetical protein n=1 Tax=Sphingomonas aerolata TaxID=185951 RepID=UPI002FE3C1D3
MRAAAFVAVMLTMNATPAAAQRCPFAPLAQSGLPKVLVDHSASVSPDRRMLAFRSKLARDEDGMPTAYHRGFADDRPDPGADHICVGGDVLELKAGKLVNKYASGGSVGDLRRAGGHSLQCKRDCIAIRDANFPACGPDLLCMRWYAVEVKPRSCGYDRPEQMGCGTPVLQRGKAGKELDYYLTANKLRRAGASGATLSQSDYADASSVPFLALHGRLNYPTAQQPRVGDYAAVVVRGRVAFGVFGDIGPATKLGEASRALLRQLGRDTVEEGGAYTVLLPGSSQLASLGWPLTADAIRNGARFKLAAAMRIPDAELDGVLRACAAP